MIINFARGHPNADLLPINAMKEALNLVQEQGDLVSYLNYPPEDNGNSELLRELSSFLDEHTALDDVGEEFMVAPAAADETNSNWNGAPFNRKNTENDFFMTHGVSHAMDLLCGTLTEPGHVVAIEVPTYFLVARIFENHGLTVQPLPMKYTAEDGIIIDVRRLQYNLDNGIQAVPNMIYTIPTHHNPTASILPIADRIHLAKLAKQYGIIIVADEVYHLLDWRHHLAEQESDQETAPADTKSIRKRPARMAVIGVAVAAASSSSAEEHKDTSTPATSSVTNSAANTDSNTTTTPFSSKRDRFGGSCLSISSFTKIFCPGIRCGWVEGPSNIVEALCQYGYLRSQGGCVPFVGELMRCALSNGLATNVLLSLQEAYYERSQLLCRILLEGNEDGTNADDSIRICTKPMGGYFLWIQLPSRVKAVDFAAYCLESNGVKILPGPSCDPFIDDSVSASSEKTNTTEQDVDFVSNHARLCFADLVLEDLEKGARRLLELLREYLKIVPDTDA
jgi:DNA-binding transcriptional MocR family regulator